MAREDREMLEKIAVDMVALSMEYIGTPESAIWEEVEKLTDTELVDFITR